MISKLLKKTLYIALSLISCSNIHSAAQTAINLPEANIRTGNEYTLEAITSGASLNSVLSVVPTVLVRGTTANFIAPGSLSIPGSAFFVKTYSVGSLIVLGSASEVPITTTAANIYTGLLGLLSGEIKVNLRIVPANLALQAGTYTNTLIYSTTGLLASIGNPNSVVNITVPAFITAETATANIALNITSFDQFRALGASASNNLNYFASVNTALQIKSNTANFSFNKTYPNLAVPVNPAALLSVKLPSSASINLSTSYQSLYTSTSVPVGNKITNQPAYTITAADLKSKFIQSGIYTLPISYSIPPTTAAAATTATISGNATVNVANMSELIVQQGAVNLTFNSTADYKNGISTSSDNQLKVSSTIPYDITVRASSANMTSPGGATLPVSIVRIEGAGGQTGVLPITLSATAQKIVSASAPEVDHLISLKYSIPATQASQVFNKPEGNYTTTITYTIVAP